MLLTTLQRFIAGRVAEHPQIAEWWDDWTPAHETQVNLVSGLEPVYRSLDAKPVAWLTPDGDQINPIRIPHGTTTDTPSFADRPLRGPEHHYWHAIGTTGWNWQERRSMWVGFDYDAIEGHVTSKAITPDQLAEIRQRACSLKYVVARTSTGGHGLHLLVPLKNRPITRNHTEHSLLAKQVLARMAVDCGFPIDKGVDCRGVILWHWRKGITSDCLRRLS